MKLKRIFALLGAVLLAGLFILAIVLAVMGAPKNYLMAVIFSLVFIPIVMYAMGLMTRAVSYTHLDVYKRQSLPTATRTDSCTRACPLPPSPGPDLPRPCLLYTSRCV